jgi:hypothetical protein
VVFSVPGAPDVLGGFALATMVPVIGVIGVIAGSGAIGPGIDGGSVADLLARPDQASFGHRHQAGRHHRRDHGVLGHHHASRA